MKTVNNTQIVKEFVTSSDYKQERFAELMAAHPDIHILNFLNRYIFDKIGQPAKTYGLTLFFSYLFERPNEELNILKKQFEHSLRKIIFAPLTQQKLSTRFAAIEIYNLQTSWYNIFDEIIEDICAEEHAIQQTQKEIKEIAEKIRNTYKAKAAAPKIA